MVQAFDPYYRWLAIPKDQQPPSHYRLLGIDPLENDSEVIAAAADRNMMHLRTFQAGSHAAEAQRLLNEISAAKVCLLDPGRKAAYDQRLRQAQKSNKEVSLPPPDAPQPVFVGELLAADAFLPSTALAPATPRSGGLALLESLAAPAKAQPLVMGLIAGAAVLMLLCLLVGAGVIISVANAYLTPDGEVANVVPESAASQSTIVAPPDNNTPQLPARIAKFPPPAPQAIKQGRTVELLPYVDIARDTISGYWRRDRGEIVGTATWFSRFELPVHPPAEFDLEVVATRVSGHEDLVVGFPYRGHSCGAVLDGWGGTGSGLTVNNGNNGAILHVTQKLVTTGQPMTVRCTVRRDQLTVTANGRQFLHFEGEPTWQTSLPNWAPRNHDCLLIGAMHGEYRIHSIKLTPIAGDGSISPRVIEHPAVANFAADGSIYLDDWMETSAMLGYGTLGKRGGTGFPNFGNGDPSAVKVETLSFDHALSTHPSVRHPALVTYDIYGQFRRLAGEVAIMDRAIAVTFSGELTFSVIGDDKTLWTSPTLLRHGERHAMDVDVSGVKRLQLRVDCRRAEPAAWAVWLSPKLAP